MTHFQPARCGMQRMRLLGCAVVAWWLYAATAHAQSTLMLPACVGQTGPPLDPCVRDITLPADAELYQLTDQNADPRQLLSWNMASRADKGFCIARNEI